MQLTMETLLTPSWPTALAVLLPALYAGYSLLDRPSFPHNAPALFDSAPVVGALRFFSDRNNFLRGLAERSPSGQASFYFGKLRIVGLAGPEGRKTFFESRELDFNTGYYASLLFSHRSAPFALSHMNRKAVLLKFVPKVTASSSTPRPRSPARRSST